MILLSFLSFGFFLSSMSCIPDFSQTPYIAEDDLELLTFPYPPPECQDCRCAAWLCFMFYAETEPKAFYIAGRHTAN